MYAVRNWFIGGVIMVTLASAPSICLGKNVPDSITLDSLAQLYEKVTFNHAKHISAVKDCAECHHHTTGTQVQERNCVRCHQNSGETKTVSCKGCHLVEPFSAAAIRAKEDNRWLYHQDKPGLKAAYHQNCMGCHAKSGGPTGCTDCHALTKTGEAFYNTGMYAPRQAQGTGKHGH